MPVQSDHQTELLIGGELSRRRRRHDRGREPLHDRDDRRAGGRFARTGRRRRLRRSRGLAAVGADSGGRAVRAPPRGRATVARGRRGAGRDDDRRGWQAAAREPRRARVDGRRLRLLRGDRPRPRRPRDPADRVDPAGDGGQGPARGRRLHRPLELPAAAARLEGRAGARRRQLRDLQAVGADAALDPDARRRSSSICPPESSTCSPAPAMSARRSPPTPRSTASPSPARSPPAREVAEACLPRMARMNLEMGGKDAFIVCADVADEIEVAARGGAWAAFLNAGQVCTSAERFYVARARSSTTTSRPSSSTPAASSSATPSRSRPTSARWSPTRSGQRSSPSSRRPASAGAEILVGGDSGGQEQRPLPLPRGGHRRRA